MNRRQYLLAGSAALASVVGPAGSAVARPYGRTGRAESSDVSNASRQTGSPAGTEPVESSHSGSGDGGASDLTIEREGPAVFTVEHGGTGRFTVDIVGGGTTRELLAVDTGPYGGQHAVDLAPGTYDLRVTADGEWTIDVVQHPQYDLADVSTSFPVELSGTGDTVHGPLDFSAERTLTVSARNQGTNRIVLRDSTGAIADLPMYNIGPLSGTKAVSVEDDVAWLCVDTTGDYSVTIEE